MDLVTRRVNLFLIRGGEALSVIKIKIGGVVSNHRMGSLPLLVSTIHQRLPVRASGLDHMALIITIFGASIARNISLLLGRANTWPSNPQAPRLALPMGVRHLDATVRRRSPAAVVSFPVTHAGALGSVTGMRL